MALLFVAFTVSAQDATPTPAPAITLPIENGQLFDTSGACAVCHANMFDEHGNNISFDTAWRATMMGNSGRDPYWRAGLRREVLVNPELSGFIQDKCATCHMPMARTTSNLVDNVPVPVFGDNGVIQVSNPLHTLAVDSISCSLCHQITPEHLGTADGNSGHYTIAGTEVDANNRIIYGPFKPDANQAAFMQLSVGGIQTQSDHIQKSELCGACHDLFTPYVDVVTHEVAPTTFQEQTPYTEWLNSDYANTKSCQTCQCRLLTA